MCAILMQVPVLPGSGLLTSADEAGQLADGIGYPVLLKATGGGGGIGIYICNSHDEVVSQFAVAARQGQANFGDSGAILHLSSEEMSVQQTHVCDIF